MSRPKPGITLIGPDVRFTGTLRFRGTCLVHGTLQGRVESDGVLEVGPTGFVQAEVDVGEVLCRGRMEGTITSRGRLALMAGSVVEGPLRTPWLVVEEGAIVRGSIAMERDQGFVPPAPLVQAGEGPPAGRLTTIAAAVALLLLAGGWALSRSRPMVIGPRPANLLSVAEEAVARKDYDRAWRLFDMAFQAQPRNEQVVLGLANVAYVQGRKPEAISYYERALELSPDHATVRGRLGELYALEGRPREALDHYRVLLEKNPKDETVLMAAAELYEQLGNAAQAVALYERYHKLNPNQGEVPLRLAALLARQGHYRKAIAAYEDLVAKRPEDVELKLTLAGVALEAGDKKRAAKLFAAVASKDPKRLEAVRSAADLYLRMGKRNRAMKVLEKAISARPGDVDLRLTLAELYRLQKQTTKARHHWREVVKRDPSNRQAALALADGLLTRGRRGEAIALLEPVASAHPEDAELHYRIGELLYKQKLWGRATEELLNVLKHDPDHVEALNRLAWLYAIQGRNLSEAVELSKRSLAIKPESPTFLDTLAEVHFQRREYREALRLIQQAVKKAPDKPYFRNRLVKFQRAAKRRHSGG